MCECVHHSCAESGTGSARLGAAETTRLESASIALKKKKFVGRGHYGCFRIVRAASRRASRRNAYYGECAADQRCREKASTGPQGPAWLIWARHIQDARSSKQHNTWRSTCESKQLNGEAALRGEGHLSTPSGCTPCRRAGPDVASLLEHRVTPRAACGEVRALHLAAISCAHARPPPQVASAGRVRAAPVEYVRSPRHTGAPTPPPVPPPAHPPAQTPTPPPPSAASPPSP